MRKYSNWVRILSIIILINIIVDLLFPLASYALTSGPTAPEYTDFEPADATDMVNLVTGDFVYNVPIFEVPGSEGGYPINLAYHSGIQVQQEASWVGLGWSLNEGAINRTVNNIPDDINGARREANSYWKGGQSLEIIAGAGIFGERFVSDEAWDTFKGFGQGYYIDISIPTYVLNINLSFGRGPYGEDYSGGGLGIGYKGLIYAGVSTTAYGNQTSNELSIGTLAGGVGVDLNSGKVSGGFSISYKGPDSPVSTNDGKISTYSKDYGFGDLNLIVVDVTDHMIYTRYWSDVSNYVDNYGSLYFNKANYTLDNNSFSSNQALDSYALFDQRSDNDIVDNPETQLGGSLPSFDTYLVAAHGIGGMMQPYIFEDASLFRQKQDANNVLFKENNFNSTSATTYQLNQGSKVNFRFSNDFSNTLSYNDKYTFNPQDGSIISSGGSRAIQPNTSNAFNPDRNLLAGSRHVEWFSNKDIINGNAMKYGFLEYPSFDYSHFADQVNFNKLYSSATNFTDQVGGFMITNSNGVTYHYGLPVYSYGEYTRMQNNKLPTDPNYTYRWESKKEPYAYTWLLTAITGPDFVDRGGGSDLTSANGVLDDGDWGYWVKFDYGKWTDKYNWRSPAQGEITDVDSQFGTYSYGFKQLYYLDAIRTRTHTAIFVKDIRQDAKGVSDFVNGEFLPTVIKSNSCPDGVNSAALAPGQDPETNIAQVNYQAYPVSTLKLEEIYLLTNQVYDQFITNEFTNLENFKISDPWAPQGQSNTCSCPSSSNSNTTTDYYKDYSNIHLQNNVIDVHDNLLATLRLNALKVADFTYTYDLCQGTPNSLPNSIADANANFANIKPAATLPATPLDYAYQSTAVASADFVAQNKSFGGKLTLASLDMLGKGGVKVVPSTRFDYGVTNSDGTLNLVNNPNYDKDKYDIWGYYKSDLNKNLLITSDNAARFVTQVKSTVDIDMSSWNLRTVTGIFGGTMNIIFEAKDYNTSVLTKQQTLRIKNCGLDANNNNNLKIYTEEDPSTFLKRGDLVGADILFWDLLDVSLITYIPDLTNVAPKTSVDATDAAQGFMDNKEGIKSQYGENSMQVLAINSTENSITVNSSVLLNAYSVSRGQFIKYVPCRPSTTVELEYNFTGTAKFVVGGVIYAPFPLNKYGGGVRVSNIGFTNSGKKITSNYSYSSGVTSYEPFNIFELILNQNFVSYLPDYTDESNALKKIYFSKGYQKIMANSSIIPSPGVMYGQVVATQQAYDIDPTTSLPISARNLPGQAVYQFETYQSTEAPNSDDVVYSAGEAFTNKTSNEVTVQNFSSRIGQLKKVSYYQDYAGTTPLSDITYTYLHDLYKNANMFQNNEITNAMSGSQYNNQGMVQQQFHEYKNVSGTDNFVTTSRVDYPSILVSQTTKDYRRGLSNKVTYLGYDFYNGLANSVLQTSPDGNTLLTQTQYAYNQYSGMGLKVNSSTNKNMLSQLYSTELYKSDATGTQSGLMSASIQTWDDGISILDAPNAQQTGIFRKKATYRWLGNAGDALNADNTYPVTSYSRAITNSGWLKTGEITFYDPFSHVLESKDADGNYSASVINYNNTKIMMSGTGGRLTDFAYAGLENPLIDNRERGVFTGDPSNALNYSVPESHTGNYSLIVSPSKIGFNTYIPQTSFTAASGFKTGQTYTASVWVYMPGYSESETNPVELSYGFVNADGSSYTTQGSAYPVAGSKSKSWYLIKLNNILTNSSNDLFIYTKNNSTTRSVYMDDFRVQPTNASANAYVYDQNTNEVTYVLDNSNLYTNYQYDNAGKVVRSMKEIFYTTDKLLMEIKENYARKD